MITRALLKTGISSSLAWSGGASVIGSVTGKRHVPLVLGYHRVVEDYAYSSRHAIAPSLVSIKTLIKQLEWVARRYEICSLDDLHRRTVARSGMRKLPAAITFDDGYADVYHNAMPVLIRKGMPFAVFATTDPIGSRALLAHDELYLRVAALLAKTDGIADQLGALLRSVGCWDAISGIFPEVASDPYLMTRALLGVLRKAELGKVIEILRSRTELHESVAAQSRVMNWSMLRDLRRAGVLIGCHSKTHAILTNEDEATVVAEATEGRTALESQLGGVVDHFAYPDGAFNDTVVHAVA